MPFHKGGESDWQDFHRPAIRIERFDPDYDVKLIDGNVGVSDKKASLPHFIETWCMPVIIVFLPFPLPVHSINHVGRLRCHLDPCGDKAALDGVAHGTDV